MQFLFADYMLDIKRRELRRGSEPIEALCSTWVNPMLRWVSQI